MKAPAFVIGEFVKTNENYKMLSTLKPFKGEILEIQYFQDSYSAIIRDTRNKIQMCDFFYLEHIDSLLEGDEEIEEPTDNKYQQYAERFARIASDENTSPEPSVSERFKGMVSDMDPPAPPSQPFPPNVIKFVRKPKPKN